MFLSLALVSWCVAPLARAGLQTQVNFDSGSQAVSNFGGTLLNPGTSADGDGAVIQLGYFDAATASDPFSGTWHALTGLGSLNTGGDTGSGLSFTTTSIGDIGGGAAPAGSGVFGLSLVFDSSVAGTFADLPGAATIPLAIRFYDGLTPGTSTYYNTVSDPAWLWKTPTVPAPLPPVINLSLDDPGLQWESIVVHGLSGSTAFHTSIVAVPEPDTVFHAIPCLVALAMIRRRKGRRCLSLT